MTYHHDYAALHAKIHGFKAAPELELSANFGNKRVFAGGSLLYNSESRSIGMTKAGKSSISYQFNVLQFILKRLSLKRHYHCYSCLTGDDINLIFISKSGLNLIHMKQPRS